MNVRTEQRIENAALHAQTRLYDEVWPARVAQMIVGAWLLLSSFLWPHHYMQGVVAQVAGVVTIVFALAGGFYQPLRALLGLLPAWLLIGTLLQPGAGVGTIMNNLFCAVAIFALSFVPRGGIRLFREERGITEAQKRQEIARG